MSQQIDRHIRRSGDDYAVALGNLLPVGRAWATGDEQSTLYKALRGLAQIWGYVDSRAADFLERESDPRATLEMLPDWERNWGLPDPCVAEPLTIEDRRKVLVLWMTLLGGQSRQFFIDVAARLGYTITITEYSPFMVGISMVGDTSGMFNPDDPTQYRWWIGGPDMRYYWTVHIGELRLTWFRVTVGQTGIDPHLRIGIATDLECIIRRWKPAHTEVIFDYSGIGGVDQRVKALLHFAGPNFSPIIIDDSGVEKTWTVHWNAKLYNGAPKFGECALLLEGINSFIDTPDISDFNLSFGDFTVDFWFRRTDGLGVQQYMVGQGDAADTPALTTFRVELKTDNTLRAQLGDGTGRVDLDGTTAVEDLLVWHHYALVRSGNIVTHYLDGAIEGVIVFEEVIPDTANKLAIGRAGELDAGYFNGMIDEFRFSVGVARWTAPFTPPTSQYWAPGPMAGTP